MKKITNNILLLSVCSLGFASQSLAQTCITPPTCAALGYTKAASDCTGKTILKCPLDQTKLFCIGTQDTEKCANPELGMILYSDMTCSKTKITGKTPIGVIISNIRRLAIALKEEKKAWSTTEFPLPGLLSNQNSGTYNTKLIVDFCKAQSKTCPAAEYAYTYSTAGTKPGDWFLSEGSDNYNLSYINDTLSSVGGTQTGADWYWTSYAKEIGTIRSAVHAVMNDDKSYGLSPDERSTSVYSVRPMIYF